MKRSLSLFFLPLLLFIIGGCASVQFYSSGDMKVKTALKFYTAKPYLLVEFKSEKDQIVKTSLIYLPDQANPLYLNFKPGIGSNELKMAFSNSILNSYGLTTDAEIPETIASMANLIAKSADASKLLASADIRREENENFILYEILTSQEGTILRRVKISE